jgi:L-amino acid N-acyltransferase YncA
MNKLRERRRAGRRRYDLEMNIRHVEISDGAAIAEIYNYYIENSTATFETEPIDAAEMERRIREKLDAHYPFFAAEENNEVVGYAYAGPFRPRAAYRHTVEVSVYIRSDFSGRGIATSLYNELFPEIRHRGFHTIIAGISLPNEASIRLHEKFGMKQVARFKEVGFKFGKWSIPDTGK